MTGREKNLIEALNALSEPLFMVDAGKECAFANNAFRQFLDDSDQNVEAPPLVEFWPDVESLDSNAQEVFTTFRLKDDQSRKVKLTVHNIGESCKLFVVAGTLFGESDVGYFHSQRLQTLGVLSAGIAHDFNNVLAGILGHITYLKTILPQSGGHVESLQAIEEGGRKASALIQEILNFSKLDIEAQPLRVDICSLIEKTCRLLRGGISPQYNLDYFIPPESICVMGVEGRLAQVIVNLAMNSRDALEVDGHIEISLRRELSSEEAQFLTDCSTGFVVLEVRDDGEGIDEEIRDRVMEPYFSTKKDRGTGLGLATVESIIHEIGGKIRLESRKGEGTCFFIYLPLLEDAAEDFVNEESHDSELLRGSENILVVDDEDPVRNVLSMSLTHLGYSVDVASSGAEAIELFQEGEGKYDLVILDMLMPGFSGEDVFFSFKEIDPQVRVLAISGYTSEYTVQKILGNGGKGFIQKPFTIEQLSSKVRECLD